MPTKRETTVIVHGMGKAFWHRLLVMLYITLRKYHAPNRAPARERAWGGAALSWCMTGEVHAVERTLG
jgi:hypothetical protein